MLSQVSKGIRLGALGWLKRSHIKAIQLHLFYGDRMGGKRRWSFILTQAFMACLYGKNRRVWVVAETKSPIPLSVEIR